MIFTPVVSTISSCFSIGAISYAVYRYRWIRRDASFDMVINVINAGSKLAKIHDMGTIRTIFSEIDESIDIASQLVLDGTQSQLLKTIGSINETIRQLYGDYEWDKEFPPLRERLDDAINSLRKRTFQIRRNA